MTKEIHVDPIVVTEDKEKMTLELDEELHHDDSPKYMKVLHMLICHQRPATSIKIR